VSQAPVVPLPIPADRLSQGTSRHHGGNHQSCGLVHREAFGTSGVGPGHLQPGQGPTDLKQSLHLEHNLGKNII